jgi:hypothetical protein
MPRTLNVKRFMNGAITPQEYHAANAFGPDAHCAGCAGKPSVRAIVMIPYDEAIKRGYVPPGHEASAEVLSRVVLLRSSSGAAEPHVRLSKAYACPMCQPAFERELARAPSWAVVDINRGPDPSNRVLVGV